MRVISQMLGFMQEPWENVTEIRPNLDGIETNAQFAQIMNPTEMVALVTFQAKVGEVEGLMNLCIPHMVVEPVMSKLSTKLWFSMIEKVPWKKQGRQSKARLRILRPDNRDSWPDRAYGIRSFCSFRQEMCLHWTQMWMEN